MFYNALFSFCIIPISNEKSFSVCDLNLTYNNMTETFASTFELVCLIYPYTKIKIPIFTVCGNERNFLCTKIKNYLKGCFLVPRAIVGDFIIIYHLAVSKRRLDIVRLMDYEKNISLEYLENGNPTLLRSEPILIYRYPYIQENDLTVYTSLINKSFAIAENEFENCF